ncbi:MAG TPA: hypothetical protein VJ963_00275 [Bacteroidales bacterium]|nr:hypothetical protein [Bacteroidales bacterium]
MDHELSKHREVLKSTSRHLFKNPNVVATGIGYKVVNGKRTSDLSIVCSVKEKLPVSGLLRKHSIASSFDGIPTDVIQTGVIRAFAPDRRRVRPAPGGVSIGHRDITAGTLGCLVKKGGGKYILSNNHILANCNKAKKGDPILQPGPYDGGIIPGDQIAELTGFVPIHFSESEQAGFFAGMIGKCLNFLSGLACSNTRFRVMRIKAIDNLVDAAIAKPLEDSLVTDEIIEISNISETVPAELGMAIKKRGRTTGLTTGEITQVDVTVTVNYDDGRSAVFKDQLMTGAMSQGGDSGSVVVTGTNRLTGLLFAGSDSITIINRIENVFSALSISL